MRKRDVEIRILKQFITESILYPDGDPEDEALQQAGISAIKGDPLAGIKHLKSALNWKALKSAYGENEGKRIYDLLYFVVKMTELSAPEELNKRLQNGTTDIDLISQIINEALYQASFGGIAYEATIRQIPPKTGTHQRP